MAFHQIRWQKLQLFTFFKFIIQILVHLPDGHRYTRNRSCVRYVYRNTYRSIVDTTVGCHLF